MTRKAFLDSNIFLNFLLKEEESYKGSKHLLIKIERGELEGVTTLV
jgi:predicted nucleic acid-binding protein